MLELSAVTLVAAVATTFALDILRPTLKLIMRPRSSKQIRVAEIEAH